MKHAPARCSTGPLGLSLPPRSPARFRASGLPEDRLNMADDSLRIADDFPQATQESWRALVEKELKGAPFDVLVSKLEGGLPLEPLYHDAKGVPDARVGMPGLPPYLRGSEAV